MNEPIISEEFEHAHKGCMLRLENEKLKLQDMKTPGLESLDHELSMSLDAIFQTIPKTGRVDPEEVFKRTTQCMPQLDRQRVLIDNIFESLKRGDNLKNTEERYQTLGLLSKSPVWGTKEIPGAKVGQELIKRKGIWKRVGTSIIRIAINAFKSIPKWVEIEPTFTFVGPIPSIGFTLKGAGMKIQDLFDILSEDPEVESRTQS